MVQILSGHRTQVIVLMLMFTWLQRINTANVS